MAVLPTIYWTMAIIGTLVTIILLFLGGHDFGVGHSVEVGHGGDLHAEVESGHFDEGPGPISLRTILAFMGGWGWGGLIGWDVFNWGVLSVPFGLAVGLLMAIIIFRFSRFLWSQEATSTLTATDIVGHEGVILTGIPAHGTGEVRVYVQGVPLKCLARAEDGEPIAEGMRVIVVEELGGTVVVRPS